MLEDAVPEPMPADIGSCASTGHRHRRPDMAALFVTEVQGFSARIRHGIVVPGREAEFMGIFAPRIGKPVLRDDGSKLGVRQYIDPRRRRDLLVRRRDDVLTSI